MLLCELLKDSLSLFVLGLWAIYFLFHILKLCSVLTITRLKPPIFRLNYSERVLWFRPLILYLILHLIFAWFLIALGNNHRFWIRWLSWLAGCHYQIKLSIIILLLSYVLMIVWRLVSPILSLAFVALTFRVWISQRGLDLCTNHILKQGWMALNQ